MVAGGNDGSHYDYHITTRTMVDASNDLKLVRVPVHQYIKT